MQKFSTRTLAYAGVLVALNVILARFVSIPVGNILRISIGSVPIILSGLWLGPVTGGICGLLGDLIGCAINGYAPNPFITVSSVLMGVLPALFKNFLSKKSNAFIGFLRFLAVMSPVFLITSLGITTYGLSVMYGMPFGATFVSRLPQSATMCVVDSFICSLLYRNIKLPQ